MHTFKPVSRLLLAFLMTLSLTSMAWSTSLAHAAPQAPLNADGTINLKTGYNGSLDVSQYNISLHPQRGPVLAPLASPTDLDSLGTGINGNVYAIAVSGSDVYVGGDFTNVSEDPNADYIAKWDGTSWSALGTIPVTGGVAAIAVNGTDVYVAGGFTNAGGDPNADYIAKWDGTNWSALGTGIPGVILTLAFHGGNLYAGGLFTNAGGDPNADYIAKWDGTNWSAVGTTPLNNEVDTIAFNGADVYAGGSFINAGGDPNADYIAKWDGASWSALGTGLSSTVYTIAFSGTDVYAGGGFIDAGGDPNADYIAKWDGTSWGALSPLLVNGPVAALAISGTNIYVGGNFVDAGGDADADYLVRWDGANWSAVQAGLNGSVVAITISGTNMYIGGGFMHVLTPNTTNRNHISKWDGSAWLALSAGLNDTVNTIATSGSDVYAGGTFTNAGGVDDADTIAKWDGTAWSALGTPPSSGAVYKVFVNASDVYAIGSFTNMGGDPNADFIAKWDGANWSALGVGLNATVNSMGINDSILYASGSFTDAGGDPAADYLAQWDGTNWSAVPGYTFTYTTSLTMSGSNLFVRAATGEIQHWDGTTWSTVVDITDPLLPFTTIYDMQASGTNLYVASSVYILAEAAYQFSVRKWDGTSWSQVGTSFNAFVTTLGLDGSDVYAGGWFSNAGGDINADYLAKWDGTNWSNVHAGSTYWYPHAIVMDGSNVLVGGDFNSPLDHIGKISIPAPVVPTQTVTPTVTETAPATGTPTITETAAATGTQSATPTATSTVIETATPAETQSATPTATPTTPATVTRTQTATAPFTATSTLTVTRTRTKTATATFTKTVTRTKTVTKTATPVSVTFSSVAVDDGTVLESSETSGLAGTLDNTSATFSVGDNATNRQSRGVMSFNTGAALPDTATVTGVILKVKQLVIVGSGNPVSILQGFMLDIKNGFFASAATLQLSDFHAVASGSYGPATPTPVNNVFSFNLANGKAFINKLSTNGGVTQIRLRFNLDDNNDALANSLSLYSSDATLAADRPQLVITYTLP